MSDLSSQAMVLAHELRESEDLPMGEALSEAWSQLRGEDDDDGNPLDIVNPLKASGTTKYLMLAGIGYLAWCGIGYLKSKTWTWTPWKSIAAISGRSAPRAAGMKMNHPSSIDSRVISGTETLFEPGRDHRDWETLGVIMP